MFRQPRKEGPLIDLDTWGVTYCDYCDKEDASQTHYDEWKKGALGDSARVT